MIRVFVQAYDQGGEPMIADHYQFAAVPRIGELVAVDDGTAEVTLRVVSVTHLSEPPEDEMKPVSYVLLRCEEAS
jgi:hypothetical protein